MAPPNQGIPMPFVTDPLLHCAQCPLEGCLEDRRVNRVRGRATDFRINQTRATNCAFDGFVPGADSDPNPDRSFHEYQAQLRANVLGAGAHLYGEGFRVSDSAVAKIEGDVFQLLQAAALWNATAAWNHYMDTEEWPSTAFMPPDGAVPTPLRRIAVIPLPRGYDATRLFNTKTRAALAAHEAALVLRGQELRMSSPDIVGLRIPDPSPDDFDVFLNPLPNLGPASQVLLETAYRRVEGKLDGHQFLFAIAVKRSVRSDRLYQPLYEANVLKYLIQEVLRGAAFRFSVHIESSEGADVAGRYKATSLASLLRGGTPVPAIDRLYESTHPRATAQQVINDYPLFVH
jgi:hypothetical protein